MRRESGEGKEKLEMKILHRCSISPSIKKYSKNKSLHDRTEMPVCKIQKYRGA